MSQVVRFHRTGGPEVLQIDDVDIGPPNAGEVRIKVQALGLNRAEAMFRAGNYGPIPKMPSRIGYEASGEVESVGDGVDGWTEGDAVSTIPMFSMAQYGVYGDLVTVPAASLIEKPPSLSWSQGASIWMQYLTAYGAMVPIGRLAKGATIIVTAASSSVGLAAIQVAKSLEVSSIAVTRIRAKRDALIKAGATYVVITDEQDLATEVARITGGKGAELAFDPVTGPGVEALAAALANKGTLILYGRLSTEPTPLPMQVIYKNLTVRGYVLASVTNDPTEFERAKRFVLDGIESGNFKPTIDRSFGFKDIVEAHRYLESNEQVGKIVVKL